MTGFLTAATKKVLSPISETRIIAVDFRNPCTHMHKFIVNYPGTFNLKLAPILQMMKLELTKVLQKSIHALHK